MLIPIVIGVTGHRDLREKDLPQLRILVHKELAKIKKAYPHSPIVMLNSLASGADTLCAETAIELGISLICPLPMEVNEYRRDFNKEDLIRFDSLLKKADKIFVVPDTEVRVPSYNRDFNYRQAGIYVAIHSNILLALWDGSPAAVGGCGTAETVNFMLHPEFDSKNFCRNANDGAVLHIATPRKKTQCEFPIKCTLIENKDGWSEQELSNIDKFNYNNLLLTNNSTTH